MKKEIDKLSDYEKFIDELRDKLSRVYSKLNTLHAKIDSSISTATKSITISLQCPDKSIIDVLSRIESTLKTWESYKDIFDKYLFTKWLASAIDNTIHSAVESYIRSTINQLVKDYYDKLLDIDSIFSTLREIRAELDTIKNEIKFAKKITTSLLTSYQLKIHDHKLHYEDELIPLAIEVIKTYHGFKDLHRLDVHLLKNKLEFDAIALFFTESGHLRSVGIEAKEHDLDKLAKQLLARRPYVHYIYGIIYGNPVSSVLYLYKSGYLDKFYLKGIGLIVVDYHGHPNIVLGSNYYSGGSIDIKKYFQATTREDQEPQ